MSSGTEGPGQLNRRNNGNGRSSQLQGEFVGQQGVVFQPSHKFVGAVVSKMQEMSTQPTLASFI